MMLHKSGDDDAGEVRRSCSSDESGRGRLALSISIHTL